MTNTATKSIEQAPSQPVLEERISPAVRQAFMGNFRNANEAVNELIDNCMADRMPRRRLDVQIELNKKKGGANYNQPQRFRYGLDRSTKLSYLG